MAGMEVTASRLQARKGTWKDLVLRSEREAGLNRRRRKANCKGTGTRRHRRRRSRKGRKGYVFFLSLQLSNHSFSSLLILPTVASDEVDEADEDVDAKVEKLVAKDARHASKVAKGDVVASPGEGAPESPR